MCQERRIRSRKWFDLNSYMNKHSITVVIPAYNCQTTIKKTVDSIFRQEKLDLIKEIIIVNDGSSDQTQQVLEKIKETRGQDVNIMIITQPNGGVSSARNRAIDVATSEWIAFLDSDDEWLSNKLKIQERVIDKCSADMVGGNIYDRPQKIGLFKTPLLSRVKPHEMLIRSFPQTSTVIIKSDIVREFGKFDIEQRYCEDLNLFVKVCSKYKYIHINKRLVYFGQGKAQIGSKSGLSSNLKQMNEGAKKNLREFYEIGIINGIQYLAFIVLNSVKYVRRKVIAKKK